MVKKRVIPLLLMSMWAVWTTHASGLDDKALKIATCKAMQADDLNVKRFELSFETDEATPYKDMYVAASPQNKTVDKGDEDILVSESKSDGSADQSGLVAQPSQTKPKEIKKKHLALPNRYSFFDLKPESELSERIYVDGKTGLIYFKQIAGTLKENIEALMAETNGTKKLIWRVSEGHTVSGEAWTKGESMYHVVNKILTPYTKPDQVKFGLYDAGSITVYYSRQRGEL